MLGEIYLEIVPFDKALRVTAIDPVSGYEVVFAAPSYTARERINELAASKLKARIARETSASLGIDAQSDKKAPASGERGRLV